MNSSYHLSVKCFSQLSFDSEVYTKSSTAVDFVHFWIKWELWKTFDAKMIGWTHFRGTKNYLFTFPLRSNLLTQKFMRFSENDK